MCQLCVNETSNNNSHWLNLGAESSPCFHAFAVHHLAHSHLPLEPGTPIIFEWKKTLGLRKVQWPFGIIYILISKVNSWFSINLYPFYKIICNCLWGHLRITGKGKAYTSFPSAPLPVLCGSAWLDFVKTPPFKNYYIFIPFLHFDQYFLYIQFNGSKFSLVMSLM